MNQDSCRRVAGKGLFPENMLKSVLDWRAFMTDLDSHRKQLLAPGSSAMKGKLECISPLSPGGRGVGGEGDIVSFVWELDHAMPMVDRLTGCCHFISVSTRGMPHCLHAVLSQLLALAAGVPQDRLLP